MFDTTNDVITRETYLADLEEIWRRVIRVFEERAAAYADDPLGRTGLYWRRFRIRGSREHPVIVGEYSVDCKILHQLHRLEKQARIRRVPGGRSVRPSATVQTSARIL
jgi:hypothetical protein